MRIKVYVLLGALLLAATLTSSSAIAGGGATCPDSMITVWSHAPGSQSVDVLRGPVLANVWVNQGAIPADGPWQTREKNPEWGQDLVKVRINWGIEAKAFWVGGSFKQYARTQACQDRMVADYNAINEPAKTLDNMEQWGILLYYHVGKR